MFRQLPAVPVCRDLPYIFLRSLFQILDVVSDRQNDLIRYETFIYQIQCQLIVSTMNPPASGPQTLAIPQAELFKPKTFARFSIE